MTPMGEIPVAPASLSTFPQGSPEVEAWGRHLIINLAGISSLVLCHRPVHGSVPRRLPHSSGGSPRSQTAPWALRGALGLAACGLCEARPFPAAARLQEAKIQGPASSQAYSREERVLESTCLCLGSPLGSRTRVEEGKADTCRDIIAQIFPSGRQHLGFSSLFWSGVFPEKSV